jgi:hypothetical protein
MKDLSDGAKVIGYNRVLSPKKNAAGEVQRFKARVVALWDHQRKGGDFRETYPPTSTVRMSHIRLILAYGAKYGLDVYLIDVRTAFLGSVLHEEVCVPQPPGWERLHSRDSEGMDRRESTSTGGGTGCGSKRIWKLVKSLYGLQESPYECYHTLRVFLVELGFVVSRVDGGFFIVVNDDSTTLILSVCVDDMLMVRSRNLIEDLRKPIIARFDMHDYGQASFYLGMQIEFDLRAGYVYLSQQTYLENILERFGMKDVKPV